MKILQLTDLHFGSFPFDEVDKKTLRLIEKLVKENEIDFLAITGDVIWSSTLNALEVFSEVIKFFDSLDVKFAITFGNHDSERKSLNYIIDNFEEQDEKLKSEFEKEDRLIRYRDNYKNLDIYGRKELVEIIKTAKNHVDIENGVWHDDKFSYFVDIDGLRLVFLDTGSYDKHGFGLYEYLNFDQIEYIEDATKEKESYIFCHIPFVEYKDVKEKNLAEGNQDETVCSGVINTGAFARLNFNTKTKAVFCGHDHENDFSAQYGNIILNYGRCSGYNTYGKLKRGGRIIEIGSDSYNSHIVEVDEI